MNKHTKGRWNLDADARENGYERAEVPFNYRGEGFCGNPFICGADGEEVVGCDEYYVFRNEADVRLICAAPDLLKALQELFADYKYLADSGDAGFWSLEEQDVGKKAIAAINKATGVNDE